MLLNSEDKQELLDAKGQSLYAPVLVLNKIEQLAHQLAYSSCDESSHQEQLKRVMGGFFLAAEQTN